MAYRLFSSNRLKECGSYFAPSLDSCRILFGCIPSLLMTNPNSRIFLSLSTTSRNAWGRLPRVFFQPCKFKIYQDAAATHYWGASNWGSASGAVGITSLNSYNGILTYCNSDFNTYYPFATNGDSNSFDVQTIALHEFGHWLNLQHSSDSSAVMYAYTSRGSIKRSLAQDDINDDKALYP